MRTPETTEPKSTEYKRPVSTLHGIVQQTLLRAREGELSVARQILESPFLA